MGSLRKKTYTKPVPEGAEHFERKGQAFVRWLDSKGRKKTAKMTTGQDGADRIIIEAATYTAKFRAADGRIREVATGCRDKSAAQSVLADLERRAERVKSKILTADEDAIAGHVTSSISEHFDDYLVNMQSRNLSAGHISEVTRYLNTLADECNFARLADVTRSRFDRWMVKRRDGGAGARTLNCFRAAWFGFLKWCVTESRFSENPLSGVPKADERADRRRQRRAMSDDELEKLLYVAHWRPLAEQGRERAFKKPKKGKRTSWENVPLEFKTIDAAVVRARDRLSDNPDRIDELEQLGRERQLIYATMLTTGLRKKELTSVRLRNLELDCEPAFISLDAANEKNRQGNSVPLRADVATQLREWLTERLTARQNEARRAATVSFKSQTARQQGDDSDNQSEAELSPDELLFNVPSSLLRVLDRDLKAAGIPKRDDRGRTLDIHALRHTFGTHLSRAGVPLRTAQAAMRHSSPELTANVYTDPRLLDIHGAVEALPSLKTNEEQKSERATGTNSQLAPVLAPEAGGAVLPESVSVVSGNLGRFKSGQKPKTENSEKPTKKARILTEKDSGLKSGRHDLNMRLPAPKAGALPS